MKVLFITRKFPPAMGGMEQFSAGFVRALDDNVTVIAWGGSQMHLIWWIPYALIRGVFLARRVDVIHIGDGVLVWMGVLLKWMTRKPVSITLHGLDVTYTRFGYQRMIWSGLRHLDRYMCVSASTAELLKEHELNTDSSSVIPNGIYPEEWPMQKNNVASIRQEFFKDKSVTISSHTKLLLTVGRLVKRKGVQWFIENVLPTLSEDILYIVAGSGPEQNVIADAVKQHTVSHRVIMTGKVTSEEVRALYAAADLFILPNQPMEDDHEGFGIVALEAAICGTPVIASRLEGLQDAVIDGSTGYLVQSSSPEAWKQGISDALDHINNHQWSAHDIRNSVVDHYDWTVIAEQYRKVFNNMLT